MKNEASWLMTIATILCIIGIFVSYSVEGVHKSPQEFISRQIIVFSVGLAFFFLSFYAFLKGQKYLTKGWVVFIMNFIVVSLLVLVLLIGESRKGAERWIKLPGGFTLQPSELAKFIVIFDIAICYSYFRDRVSSFFYGIFIPLSIGGLYSFLIFLEKDLGTPVVIMACVFILMRYAGVKTTALLSIVLIGLAFVGVGILMEPYRLERVLNTINYTSDIKGGGAQIFQAMVAFYRGGLLGVGLGEGKSKVGVLPLPSRDFPLALWVEETGLIGGLVLILLYYAFAMIGLETAVKAPTFRASMWALGVTVIITGQALMMILVNEGWLPVKGMCVPFVSSGGSSLVSNMIMLGCLVAVAIQKNRISEKKSATLPPN